MSEPFDPDLSQALEELGPMIPRLHQLEEDLAHPSATSSLHRHGQLVHARNAIIDRIINRAKALNLKPGSLRLAVELANKHRGRARRKISLPQLRRDLDLALGVLRTARLEADATLAIAQHRAARAALQVEAGEGAAAYLDASL